MKSTWFGCSKRYEFAKCIRDADHGRMIWDTFSGFLTCASYSLRQGVYKLQTGEMSDEFEETVLKEQNRFKDWTKFSEALGILVLALEQESYDFLGTFMSEMEMNDSKWKGQCFTPQSVCNLMAEMSCQRLEPQSGRTLLLNEPACGGGAMVIATSEILKRNGFFPWHYFWMAVDVDWRCFAMTYIQLTLLGIPAKVIHGNSITLETFSEAVTFAGVMHPPKKDRFIIEPDQPETEPEKPTPKPQPQQQVSQEPVQLTLF